MAVAIGLWSLILEPGKPASIEPQADLRVTNFALGHELKDTSGRTTVKLVFESPIHLDSDDEDEEESAAPGSSETIVCSLTPNKIEQAMTDIVLHEDELYVFEALGKNTIYLTGNYVEQNINNPPLNDMDMDDDSDSDESEDAYDLREVSSDVEMDPNDLDSDASRFEEIDDEAPKNLKRPRDADAEASAPTTKAEKKKKLKGENGKAVTAPVEEKKEKKDKAENKSKAESATSEKKLKPTEKEIAGGIKVLDSKIGTGPMAKKGSKVSMRYIGKLQNGKIFDQNTKDKPFSFHLGKGEVIKGWDEGIVGMHVGGERRLTIPPAMAYGKKGTEGIPKNATLVFDCKLIDIK